MTKLYITIVCMCLALSACAGIATAQNAPELLTRSIKVVTADGQPVAGALADAWLVNEDYFWPSKDCPRQLAKTGPDGVAQVRYPKYFGNGQKSVESIKLTVSHADFMSTDVTVPIRASAKPANGSEPSDKAFEIPVQPGVALTLAAVDENGQPVKDAFAVSATWMRSSPRWNRPAPDKAQTRSVKDGNHQMMLVQPDPNRRHRFSPVLAYQFKVEKQAEVVIDDIELRPGITVRGKLASEVTRPVKNGYVLAVQAPLPAGESWDETAPSLTYLDSTDLREDGTFEFPSMPHSGDLQLIALCDGWVGLSDQRTPLTVGQTFPVDDQDLDVELKMLPTFDAKIRVIDPSGNPLAGIFVACSPNQQLMKTGNTWLGARHNSLRMLNGQLVDSPEPSVADDENSFQAESDKEGRVLIRNLPRNRYSTSFVAWPSPKSGIKIERPEDISGKLPSPNETEVEFDIQLKVLSRK